MTSITRRHFGALAGATALAGPLAAPAIAASGNVKIGVLSDMSGITSAPSGVGSAEAVRMAVADHGGRAAGLPIEVIQGDCQLKPDVAAAIAGAWFDQEGVDVIVDIPQTAVALATIEAATRRNKTTIVCGAVASVLTGKACTAANTHWVEDTYAIATALCPGVVAAGRKDWYFITADYAFGHELQSQATDAIVAAGGRVVGTSLHPFGNADFASFLLKAQAANAQAIALANVGTDLITAIKQGSEFGLTAQGRAMVGFLVFINDVHALGAEVAQGMYVIDGFYWNQNDDSRAFAKRFFDAVGRAPSKEQASCYASTRHYLRAVDAAGSADTAAVNKAMRAAPFDFFGRKGNIRVDGRAVYDLTVYQVKKPSEVKQPWDYYQPVRTIPGDKAFRALDAGGCPLVTKS